MLSILIPVYNRNVCGLVRELHRQAELLKVPFELICMDDASTLYREENRAIASLEHVRWIGLPENTGRAAIRNKLIEASCYACLLFLDCDMEICREDYLEVYMRHSRQAVVCGGRIYAKEDLHSGNGIHYHYGVAREQFRAGKRDEERHFISGNFFIHKRVFEHVRFCEALSGYGHEDTLFGIELHEAGIAICYPDNPTIHRGVDGNDAYLDKTREAIDNLFHEDSELERKLHGHIRLTRFAAKHNRMLWLCGVCYEGSRGLLELAMKRFPGYSHLMDLYKLSYLGNQCIKRQKAIRGISYSNK